jgi:hypothetical protein
VAAAEAEAVGFFTSATANLLAAEQRTGVRHHVVLVHRPGAHRARQRPYGGQACPRGGRRGWVDPVHHRSRDAVPYFPATVVDWVEQRGVAQLPPLLMQPIAPADVANVSARQAGGPAEVRSSRRGDLNPEPSD